MGKICVVGSANVDFIMQLPRLPLRGENVLGGPFTQSFGGKGSNQAVAARRAGAEVTLVANLGGEPFAGKFMDVYRSEGIDAAHVRVNPGYNCGTGFILVDQAGDNLIATDLGANAFMTVDQVEAAAPALAAADLILLQMESPDPVIVRAVAIARDHDVPVMLNYAPSRQSAIRLDAGIDILVMNESEAAEYTGIAVASMVGAERAALALAENGHRMVIVTMGADGCIVVEEGMVGVYPAFPVTAVDTTGAGDTFCGALAAALARGEGLTRAVRFAAAAGALCAGRLGALPSIPTLEEIERFLADGCGDGSLT